MFLALPVLFAFKLGLINNSDAKEKLLSTFFKGTSLDEFRNRCKIFGHEKIPLILNTPIVEKFQQHISNGDEVVIVSASIDDWIIPWAKQWDVQVLATRLASENSVLTGKFDGSNCNGVEKVKCIKSYFTIEKYDRIIAYGDSSGDEPMLSLADTAVYRGKTRK